MKTANQRGVLSAAAGLEAPTVTYAPTAGVKRGGGDPDWRAPEPAPAGALQRGYGVDASGSGGFNQEDEEEYRPRRGAGGALRPSLRGMLRSTGGRIVLGTVSVVLLGAAAVGFVMARTYVLHDPRFVVAGSDDIQISGNAHLSRAQVLSVFGGDLERNIFRVSLAERRADLERLPWVEHATVMRLLPDRLRVQIKERTPVAFVRQGTQIGLVDANGVLLDLATDAGVDAGVGARYSFPVLTGIEAGDPLSTRAARMAIYQRFMKELDSTGKGFSKSVSEVDVTDPEDVKALVPGGSSEVLVHFGDEQFLGRYNEFEKHLPEWQQQYPKLASADMRYEGQIVLEMRKDGAVAPDTAGNAGLSATSAKSADSGRDDKAVGGGEKTVAKTRIPEAGPGAPSVASGRDGKSNAGVSKAGARPLPVPVKAKVAAKGKPVVKKVAAKASKPAAPHAPSGSSAANEKMYAALAAQRKAAEAKAGGGGR
jgi:cell division protein FtsQ